MLKSNQVTIKIAAFAFMASFVSIGAISPVLAQNASYKDMVQKAPYNEQVVATVNGKSISVGDLVLAEEELFAMIGDMPQDQRMQALVGFLVDRSLASEAAKAAGISVNDPDVQVRLAFYTEKALQEIYVERQVAGAVSDEKVSAFYQVEIASKKPVEEVRARHILVASEDEAKKIVAELKAGADFEALAKEKSTGPSGPSGGDLGYFTADQMVPEFSAASFKLKPGGISEPVKTQFGWHVIKLEDKRTQPVPAFNDIAPQITDHLMRQAQAKVYEELREEAKIEFIKPAGAK